MRRSFRPRHRPQPPPALCQRPQQGGNLCGIRRIRWRAGGGRADASEAHDEGGNVYAAGGGEVAFSWYLEVGIWSPEFSRAGREARPAKLFLLSFRKRAAQRNLLTLNRSPLVMST